MRHLRLSTLVLAGLPTVALAAGFPAVPAPLPVFTWTGFYTGTFLGYGALDNTAQSICDPASAILNCRSTPNVPHPDGNGLSAGSEAGYTLQFANGLVLGVAGDYQFTRLRDFGEAEGAPRLANGNVASDVYHVGASLDDLATLRGRIGFAYGRALVYASGGVAAGQVTLEATRTETAGNFGDTVTATQRDWRVGYMAGGGVEYAFTDRLSAKLEGDYFNLGTRTDLAPDQDGRGLERGARVAASGYLVRAGLDYHFGNALPFAGLFTGADAAGPAMAPPSPWSFESGLRYFYSVGRHQHEPFSTSDVRLSRLTYSDASAHAGESFARLDNMPTNLFIKGMVGSGETVSGRLHDEDFPPTTQPYSNTLSSVKSGDLAYATVDAGYEIWRTPALRFGGFLGYAYYADTYNADGCKQGATSTICVPTVPTSIKILSEDEAWNAFRVGGTLDANWNRFRATFDGAFLPVTAFSGFDHHWLRPDINPRPQDGNGRGYQLEGVLSYAVTDNLSLGIGGRYWHFDADGSTKSPFALPNPLKAQADRVGGFLQASYLLPPG